MVKGMVGAERELESQGRTDGTKDGGDGCGGKSRKRSVVCLGHFLYIPILYYIRMCVLYFISFPSSCLARPSYKNYCKPLNARRRNDDSYKRHCTTTFSKCFDTFSRQTPGFFVAVCVYAHARACVCVCICPRMCNLFGLKLQT